jgi:hypothetical protein
VLEVPKTGFQLLRQGGSRSAPESGPRLS